MCYIIQDRVVETRVYTKMAVSEILNLYAFIHRITM